MEILALLVPKEHGEDVRAVLYSHKLLDRRHYIQDRGDYLQIPIKSEPAPDIKAELSKYYVELITLSRPEERPIPPKPFEHILKRTVLAEDLKKFLPRKWELIGDVLIIKFPPELAAYHAELAGLYSEILTAETVLQENEGITGVTRKPSMEIIKGSRTETIHIENGIKFALDTLQLMFSSGNISERIRMAEQNCPNEIVVDMFAGIGYFTLPIAVYTQPKRVIACEINPVALAYLKRNIELNGVANRTEAVLGDCRETAPEGVADRIIMGHIKPTLSFLTKAVKVLKPSGGIIHYHDVCPTENFPHVQLKSLEDAGRKMEFEIEMIKSLRIKSYAPGISHVVLDVKFFKR